MRSKTLSSVWKDPVVSGVLAAVLGTLLYNAIVAGVNKISVAEALKNFWTLRFELWIYLLAVLIVMIIYFVVRKIKMFKYDTEMIALDKKMVTKIRSEILPQETLIKWLRDQDFGAGFEIENLVKIGKIVEENKNPDFEFFHPQVEKKKKLLVNSIEIFTESLGRNMFGKRSGGISVPPNWEFDQPDRFEKALEEIDTRRVEVCKRYDDFIRTGRRILKV